MKIEIPTECPSCGSKLERVKDQLICRNKDCPAQSDKKLGHFAKALKIKGLGEKTIEKLELSGYEDLFTLEDNPNKDKIGEKNLKKLVDQIALLNTEGVYVGDLLTAFSIPLAGKATCYKLSDYLKDINDISFYTCKDAGLGDKAATNIVEWWVENSELVSNLPIMIQYRYEDEKRGAMLKVCISGKIPGFTKNTLATYLASKGVDVTSSVSRKIDYLIADSEDSNSTKAKKAQSLGIPITTLDNFIIKEKLNEH